MSREIKFRVYDKTKGYYVAIRDNDCFGIRQTARVIVELTSLGHEFILEQYTGLKDKNGKKIYEGDVVKGYFDGREIISEVRYLEGSFDVIVKDYSPQVPQGVWCRLNAVDSREVIGNVNENPDLLEKGE